MAFLFKTVFPHGIFVFIQMNLLSLDGFDYILIGNDVICSDISAFNLDPETDPSKILKNNYLF